MIMNQINAQQLLINAICIFLLTFSHIKISNNRNHSFPYINAFIITNILANLFELVRALYSGYSMEPSTFLLYFLHGGYYCSALAACGCWFINSLQITNSVLYRKKQLLCITVLPLFVLVALTLTASFNHLIFYVDSNGQYVRGEWFVPFIAVAGLYLLVALCFYIYADYNKEIYVFKTLNRVASIYTLFLLVFTGFQILSKGVLSVINAAAALVALMIHEDLQQKEITIDSLTKLNNRNAINANILRLLKHRNHSAYAVMLDLDYFKKINDSYGHLEGDKALKYVAEALRREFTDNTFFGRLAGDEFFILAENCREEEIDLVEDRLNVQLADIMKAQNAEFSFTVSAGACKISDEMSTIPDVIKAADDALYSRKRAKKTYRA